MDKRSIKHLNVSGGHRRAWAARPIRGSTSLVVLGMILTGCVATPKQPDQPAVPTNTTSSTHGDGSSADEVVQRNGPKTEFHKTATERQRFQVHIDFGRIFENQGNYDAALLEYRDALAVAETRGRGHLKPIDEALAHRRMAGAFDRSGQFAQAEVHYKRAIKLSPKDPKIWNDAGYSFYLQGRWPEAEGALKTAVRLAPDDERIRTNLGLTLAAAGRPKEALPLLSHAVGDAVGHMNLGYSLAATGQSDLARQQYETALAMQPNLDLARRALAQLDRQIDNLPASDSKTRIASTAWPLDSPAIDSGVHRASAALAVARPPTPSRSLPHPKPPEPAKWPIGNLSAVIVAAPAPAPTPMLPILPDR